MIQFTCSNKSEQNLHSGWLSKIHMKAAGFKKKKNPETEDLELISDCFTFHKHLYESLKYILGLN